ncbi:hypothetical protein BGY98DRAFT_1049955 [Russula aff. rugulosa BPL654]|nr:hypothetical protein BGY98DRAFT_1049955 [Russula aff. rugulosa BPL654]
MRPTAPAVSSPNMQEESGEAKNNGNNNSKGRGEGEAKAGNHSTKGGQGTQQNQNQDQDHSQQPNQPKRQPKQQQQHNHNHPNGQPSGSGSGSAQYRRGGGSDDSQVHAGQRRKATESLTNGSTGADGGDRGDAPKRHKTDVTRSHPDFWYPDGSVIIQVKSTQFRLHQSMLQKQSALFAAAFEETRNLYPELEVRVDERSLKGHDLPVYNLDDIGEMTADDFATLLTVIEEPMKYADETPPMPVLAGVLCAAQTLSFEAYRKWAERILERMWPATLDALTNDPIPHAAFALALARTCGLRGVQKRAGYELLRTSTFGQAIVASPAAQVQVRVQEGSRADADAEMGLNELPRAELLRLVHAREQLIFAWAEVAGRAPTDFVCPRGMLTQVMPESGGGSSTTTSNAGRRSGCASASVDRVNTRWAELVHTSEVYMYRMADPLMGLQDLINIPWREEGFCDKCVAARTKTWNEFRRMLWDRLDEWLQLTECPIDRRGKSLVNSAPAEVELVILKRSQ